MKKTILLAAALVLVLVFAAFSQIVFQLTEPEGPQWASLAPHVHNLRTAFAQDGGSQVEVVFFGAGLSMLRKSNSAYADRLKQLADNGVTLAACRNAMRLMNVKTDDLFPFASQVDSGAAEFARKQEANWAYIN